MPMTVPLTAPGAEPTHCSEAGGSRWHYTTPDGSRLDPPAYLYKMSDLAGGGWGGECDNSIFPDGYSPPGPATREHVEQRVEAMLSSLGFRVVRVGRDLPAGVGMTSARYAELLREALPGWTVEPDSTRGVLRLQTPRGAVGYCRPSTGAYAAGGSIRFWSDPHPEYIGRHGPENFAAMLRRENP